MGDRCLGCGTVLPVGARFCPDCGVPLAPPSAGDRRMVTVVFADFAGFTALAEGTDPETIKRLLDRCFGGLVPVILRFGGHVDKIIGDELMATFGAPITHEDDPERAVRAALALMETLPTLAPDLTMRVGVNTGEVLAGPVGPDRSYTVTGDTVNTAHRLVSVAQPGEVLVGERTYQSTSDAIAYEPRPPYRLRGKQIEVNAWVATGVRSGPHVGVSNLGVPLIGRDHDLDQLMSISALVQRTRTPTVVVVTGEPGLGKTRLAYDLVIRLLRRQPNHQVLWAGCPPYGAGSELEPIADIVRAALTIDRGAPRSAQLEQLQRRLDPLASATKTEPAVLLARLAQLLGLRELPEEVGAEAEPSRARVTDQLLSSARALLLVLSTERPTMIVIDDLQWADDSVISFVEHLPERVTDRPLMVLALARGDLIERRPSLVSGRPGMILYPLSPLAPDAAAEMLAAILSQLGPSEVEPRLGPGAEQHLLEGGGGNPLLIEQLLFFLIERKTLLVEGGRWRLQATFDAVGIPDGVRSLLGARLDGLPPAERQLLHDASVVGLRFWRDILVHLGAPSDVDELLAALVDRGLIERVPSNSEPGEVQFRHVLTREVAYASLPLAARAHAHAEVARWLQDHADGGEPQGWLSGQLAYHFERAVTYSRQLDLTDPGLAAAAFAALTRAGGEAHRNGALREADGWYASARSLGSTDQAAMRSVLLEHGHVLVSLRRLDEARQTLEEVRRSAAAEPAISARAAALLGVTNRLAGDLDGARDAFDQARATWIELGDRVGEAQALHLQGWSELLAGRPRAARPMLEHAADLQEAALGTRRGATLRALGWSSFLLGDIAEAREKLWMAAGAYAVDGDRAAMAWCLGILGYTAYQTGEIDAAVEIATVLLDRGPAVGESNVEGLCEVLLAACDVARGHPVSGQARAEVALRTFEEQTDIWGTIIASLVLAIAARISGRPAEARRLLDETLSTVRTVQFAAEEARLLVELAAAELDLGELEAATRRARAALALVRAGHGDHDSSIRALTLLARLTLGEGDALSAQLLAEQAVGLGRAGAPTDSWRRANAALAWVLLDAGDLEGATEAADRALEGSVSVMETHLEAVHAWVSVARATGRHAECELLLDVALGGASELSLPVVAKLRALRGS